MSANENGRPAVGSSDERTAAAQWGSFRRELGRHLMIMQELGDRLRLDLGSPLSPLVEVEVVDCEQQLMITVRGLPATCTASALADLRTRGWGHQVSGSDWVLRAGPDSDLESVAAEIVAVLTWQLSVPVPGLLTCRGSGDSARALPIGDLRMTESGDDGEVSISCPPMLGIDGPISGLPALQPADRDELFWMVHLLLEEMIDRVPDLDEEHDFVLHHLGQRVSIQVDRETFGVCVQARVAHEIPAPRRAALELSVLNRDHRWIRWILRDDTVWQEFNLLAQPFVPKHLGVLLDLFLQTMTSTRDDLVYRIGARVG